MLIQREHQSVGYLGFAHQPTSFETPIHGKLTLIRSAGKQKRTQIGP
jgi:hypothetical protein